MTSKFFFHCDVQREDDDSSSGGDDDDDGGDGDGDGDGVLTTACFDADLADLASGTGYPLPMFIQEYSTEGNLTPLRPFCTQTIPTPVAKPAIQGISSIFITSFLNLCGTSDIFYSATRRDMGLQSEAFANEFQ